jgi:acetyltransferase-like isoleucine patch superfamily enzyme
MSRMAPYLTDFELRILRFVRARTLGWLGFPRFARVGRLNKIAGGRQMQVGKGVRLGDFCWLEAVTRYGEQQFTPRLIIGDDVRMSDSVHISVVSDVRLGAGCLLGSRIYIGDHTHGDSADFLQLSLPPGDRPLGKVAPIEIGANTWLCDGVVVLPGTRIAAGSIVGANAVVRLQTFRPAVIAGNPATIVKYLDENE